MATTKKKKPLKTAATKPNPKAVEEVSLTCACNREITLTELGKIYKFQKKTKLEKFLPLLNSMFTKYEINSCLRKAHILAQIGHETGQLRLLEEDLGKHKNGKSVKESEVYDGYKGRGLLQITWKAGYVAYGDYVGQDFTDDNKAKLAEPAWATDSAGWYWNVKMDPSLNTYADNNDLIYISQAINGAFNGYDDRKELINNAANALLIGSCPNLATPVDMTTFVFGSSAANDIAAAAFAWGLWHDPNAKQKGTGKDIEEAKSGYTRFIELKAKQKRARFGFKSAKAMIAHAESRLVELNK